MDNKIKIVVSLAAVAVITILMYSSYILKSIDNSSQSIITSPIEKVQSPFKNFTSADEFAKKMDELSQNNRSGMMMEKSFGVAPGSTIPMSAPSAAGDMGKNAQSNDFSQTNIQVAGVDEADIVKTDGQYVYTVAGSYLTITKALPAEEATLVTKIKLDNSTPQEFFIRGNKLMVFGNKSYYNYNEMPAYTPGSAIPSVMPRPRPIYPYFQSVNFVNVYDLSDIVSPKLVKKMEFDGNYKTSRMIGDNVYIVFNNYSRSYGYYPMEKEGKQPSAEEKCRTFVPQYREGLDMTEQTEPKSLVGCLNIHYIEPISNPQYSTIVGINIADTEKEISKEVLLGAGDNIYASQDNIYLAQTEYGASSGPQPLIYFENNKDEKTRIYKIGISDGQIKYKASGAVPGTVLNQFSMDESNGFFRIATTSGHISRDQNNNTSNNVYILDENLNQTGSLEDIAPGEKIYSARFMGSKAFLVTFKKVDPLFTLDLSDPKNPQIIGKLKIPGFSDYMHPYDENHIIGIGKNTVEASETMAGNANFAWYQGIKMAMFDVTDYANPKEMYKIEIGDRGTDSPILNDHKALLFSKEKNLLVIPILEAKLSDEQKRLNQEGDAYGDYVYQGAYVFDVNLENGFNLKGRVSHFQDDSTFKKSGYYFDDQTLAVKRSLFIDNNLYTISDGKIMINHLNDLSQIKEVDFGLPKEEVNSNRVFY